MSPATQRRGESPRKVSLGVTVSHHCRKPPGQIAPQRLRIAHAPYVIVQQGCGRGARAPGHAAGRLGRVELDSDRRASREGCAGCGAPRRGGQSATRAAAARADSPGRPDTPIGPRRANQRPRLSLQRGRGLNSQAASETLAASTKPAGGRSAALLPPRASLWADTPASLKPFEKCPFERKLPPGGLAGTDRGKFVSFFKLFWSP